MGGSSSILNCSKKKKDKHKKKNQPKSKESLISTKTDPDKVYS